MLVSLIIVNKNLSLQKGAITFEIVCRQVLFIEKKGRGKEVGCKSLLEIKCKRTFKNRFIMELTG